MAAVLCGRALVRIQLARGLGCSEPTHSRARGCDVGILSRWTALPQTGSVS
jgi:hypothetical protein